MSGVFVNGIRVLIRGTKPAVYQLKWVLTRTSHADTGIGVQIHIHHPNNTKW